MLRVFSTPNFKPVFPTFSLDERGKKCMNDSWRPITMLPPNLGPNIDVYNTHSSHRYFKHGKFITPNNLYHPGVLTTFLRATRSIQGFIDSEQHPFETTGDRLEITIVIRCISPKKPEISYYIADHTDKTVRWLHGHVPRCYNTDADPRMRDCAEYWHHRSKFSVHRHCTPDDRAEVATLLKGMLDPSQGDANVDRPEIENYMRKLDNIPLSSPLTDHQTSILAEIYSEALKHSLPAFYSPSPSLKGKLYKSLFGWPIPRFIHNHTHRNPGASVSQVIQEHLQQPNHPTTPRHPSRHTEDSPPQTPSQSSSNSN
ncbi:hypothetical protein OPQ81_010660 [Rhizoctonia solani]|nr:hypothetical protein OPQ81_010660 [Rhizoctonia solani]